MPLLLYKLGLREITRKKCRRQHFIGFLISSVSTNYESTSQSIFLQGILAGSVLQHVNSSPRYFQVRLYLKWVSATSGRKHPSFLKAERKLCAGLSQPIFLQLGQLHLLDYFFCLMADLYWQGHSRATMSHSALAEVY